MESNIASGSPPNASLASPFRRTRAKGKDRCAQSSSLPRCLLRDMSPWSQERRARAGQNPTAPTVAASAISVAPHSPPLRPFSGQPVIQNFCLAPLRQKNIRSLDIAVARFSWECAAARAIAISIANSQDRSNPGYCPMRCFSVALRAVPHINGLCSNSPTHESSDLWGGSRGAARS